MSKERSDLLDKRDSEARETSGGESRRRTLIIRNMMNKKYEE